jgi:membrane protein DedA with SNARE-associated domain
MSFTKFVTYNGLSSVIWAIVFGWLGYYFGHDLPLLESYISRVSLFLLITLAVAIPLFIVWKRRRRAPVTAPVSVLDAPSEE